MALSCCRKLAARLYFVYMKKNQALKTQAAKWGNSLAVRLPKTLASQLGIQEGTSLEISIHTDKLMIKKPSLSLDDLVAGITPENLHDETMASPPVGREIW